MAWDVLTLAIVGAVFMLLFHVGSWGLTTLGVVVFSIILGSLLEVRGSRRALLRPRTKTVVDTDDDNPYRIGEDQ